VLPILLLRVGPDHQIKLVAGLDDEVLNDLKGKKLSKQFEIRRKYNDRIYHKTTMGRQRP
jgi:hypothetical protein